MGKMWEKEGKGGLRAAEVDRKKSLRAQQTHRKGDEALERCFMTCGLRKNLQLLTDIASIIINKPFGQTKVKFFSLRKSSICLVCTVPL